MNKKKFTVGLYIDALLLFIIYFFIATRVAHSLSVIVVVALVYAILNLLALLLVGTIIWAVARAILRKQRQLSWRFMVWWTITALTAIEFAFSLLFLPGL